MAVKYSSYDSSSGNVFSLVTITGATGVYTTTLSGETITGNVAAFTTVTGGSANFSSGTFTSQVSGATVTGDTAKFTNITGVTLAITTPSGATPAVVCSGVISGGVSGFVIQGPLIILP